MFTKQTLRDLSQGDPQLVRWNVALPWGWSVRLHLILQADADRCAHNHPWWFVRVILWGGYYEECGNSRRLVLRKPWRPWAPWRVYWCGPEFRHRITTLPRGRSLSLVLAGPWKREWGFYTRDGWMDWRTFIDTVSRRQVLWCDDGRALNEDDERADMGVVIREMRKRPWNLE